ncbi:MAG TPA: Ig-like domain repeat protein [Candidatus Limnocylindrales bacterium]|nr:Ig-like domain repeat protein [Candidatus Limnocylindrales bacterium]
MKGQSLIEALLAISVIGIIVSGISVIVTSSLKNVDYGKRQVSATQSAQEGIEILQKIRNSNYSEFQSYNGTYCLDKNATSISVPSSCTAMNYDNFIRSVTIEQSPGCAENVAKATVNVAWSDSKCSSGVFCHKSSLVSCLSKIKPSQFSEFGDSPVAGPGAPTTIPTATPTSAPPAGGGSISMTVSPNPVSVSQSITFTATVTGSGCTPTGAVYFYRDGQPSYFTAASTGNSNPGVATAGYPANAIGAGSHTVFGRYVPGGTTCPGRDSAVINFTVN